MATCRVCGFRKDITEVGNLYIVKEGGGIFRKGKEKMKWKHVFDTTWDEAEVITSFEEKETCVHCARELINGDM